MASWHQRNTHWSQGLLLDLSSPQNWLLSNEDVVVVHDRYPKAMYHFLVLPRVNIPSIFEVSTLNCSNEPKSGLKKFPCSDTDFFKRNQHFNKHFKRMLLQLTRKHLNLLNEMYLMALNVITLYGREPHEFQIGYHAEPSLQQLHMHVISTDFYSPTLKTSRHWNSFNTELFIPHEGNPIIKFPNLILITCNCLTFIFRIGASHCERGSYNKIVSSFGVRAAEYAITMSSLHNDTAYNRRTQVASNDSHEMAVKHHSLLD